MKVSGPLAVEAALIDRSESEFGLTISLCADNNLGLSSAG